MAHLGEHSLAKSTFGGLDAVFKDLKPDSESVNRALLALIQKAPEPAFLLSAVLHFVEMVDQKGLLEKYTLTTFELWLNQHSGLSFEDNRRIRAKIVGKWLDRGAYQGLFPIGMGKVYEGTHFVTAHKSPDLDTTVASFWGWVDAFGARVGDGLHVWNLPGGPPASQIEIEWIFKALFGNAVFTHLAKTQTTLTLTGSDLMTQKGLQKKSPADLIGSIDHDRDQQAVIVVDEQGTFLGDWRHFDVENVRQLIIVFGTGLRWFENTLQLQLIALFAKPKLALGEAKKALEALFALKLSEFEPAREFSSKQKREVASFLVEVLGVPQGLEATFSELNLAEIDLLSAIEPLFDSKGHLVEDRPRIFGFLQTTLGRLHDDIVAARVRLEGLDIALKTKYAVFGRQLNFVTLRSEMEEIRTKIGTYPYLTVAQMKEGKLVPIGIIPASLFRKNMLGTVSLRDFCNRDEMGIPTYLDVVSVIDHHKSVLSTFAPPLALIADVQSCNTLVAQAAFIINDSHSLRGQTPGQIEKQIAEKPASPILRTLLQKREIAEKKLPYYVHPEREFIEYLHFLYGILDDTDLLSKVSAQDVDCVVSLLNRLKSLSLQREVEVLSLADLPRDAQFAHKGAERILRNEEMYSLYRKVYSYREAEVTRNLELSAKAAPSNLFADTKEQNGCCRVGQAKIFAANVSLFEKRADAIRLHWVQMAVEAQKKKPELDLHIQMISTIVSAEEVFQGANEKHPHSDEMWIWIPSTETGVVHLKRFLSAFQSSPGIKDNPMEVEFLGDNGGTLDQIFQESFSNVPRSQRNQGIPIAVLRYRAGSLNSRKAMVSPFLPTV